jgi:hypothetical protein
MNCKFCNCATKNCATREQASKCSRFVQKTKKAKGENISVRDAAKLKHPNIKKP